MGDKFNNGLSKVPAVTLGFWIIKILATTLGETGGDTVTMTWLGETTDHPMPSAALAVVIILLIVILPQRPGRHPERADAHA